MCTKYLQSFTFVAIVLVLVALSAAKPFNKHRLPSDEGIGTTPSTTLTLRIQCKILYFLQIADDGVVNGSTKFDSPNVILQLQSAGPHGLVRIYSTRTKRYVAMNSKGKVNSTFDLDRYIAGRELSLTPTEDTVFKYEQLPSGYHNFKSVKHLNNQKPMFLALRQNGKAKKGTKTDRYHKSTQFVEVR